MKRLLLPLIAALALPTAVNADEVKINCDSPVFRESEQCAEKEPFKKEPFKIDKDINIKGIKYKRFVVDKLIEASGPPNQTIIYDHDYKGQGCVIGCDRKDGVIAKWSNYFLELQPYTELCYLGCDYVNPIPSKEIILFTGTRKFNILMTNTDNNQYYLPLQVRQAIASSKELSVEISGVDYPVYKVKKENHIKIVDLVNTEKELNIILI